MIRFLGVMVGSAATLGGMLLLLGQPEFHSPEPHNEEHVDTIETVATNPIEETTPVEREEPAMTRPSTSDIADGQRLPPSNTPSPGSPDTTMSGTSNPDQPAGPPLEASPAPEDSTFSDGTEQNWHSFWNPFRSEIAANGFAARLTRVTGIDYRVLRLKPGSYQVAFAYADADERRTKIAQIEQATGLELPEDSL